MSECIVQNVVCEKNFPCILIQFLYHRPLQVQLEVLLLHIANSDLVFLMEFFVV